MASQLAAVIDTLGRVVGSRESPQAATSTMATTAKIATPSCQLEVAPTAEVSQGIRVVGASVDMRRNEMIGLWALRHSLGGFEGPHEFNVSIAFEDHQLPAREEPNRRDEGKPPATSLLPSGNG